MTNPPRSRLSRFVLAGRLGLVVCFATLAMPAVHAGNPAAPDAGPLPKSAIPGVLPGTAAAKKGPTNEPLPNTAAERAKLLSNLYAYLATAEDEKQARPITDAIERLWLFAGSDTIGLLMDRSARAVGEKNYDLALKFLDAVVELAPDYAEGWNRRGYVHYLRNDVERMVGDLRRCLALEPNHYRAMEALGSVLRETGQKKAALRAFERVIEINPNATGAADAVKDLSRDVDGQRT